MPVPPPDSSHFCSFFLFVVLSCEFLVIVYFISAFISLLVIGLNVGDIFCVKFCRFYR